MNRVHKAWLALTGRLEPEVREVEVPVIGEAAKTDLYCARVPDPSTGMLTTYGGEISWGTTPIYFATCEQAHSTHPGLHIERVTAIKAGGSYFVGPVVHVKVQPKPKRPKGTRA